MVDSEPSAAPPPPAPRETVGERLRAARLAQSLSLEQLSTELRIDAKHLDALEHDHFEVIGVPVFIKGYLKQYGARLGLQASDLLALYHEQATLPEVEIQPSRSIKLHDERQITSWVLAGIVLLSVATALAVWWWNGGNFDMAPLLHSTESAAPRPAPDEPLPPPVDASAGRPPPLLAPIVETPVSPPAEPEAGGASAAPAAADEPAPAGDAAAPSTTISLQFTFDAESWAEVTDARGERLLFGLNAAGRSVTVQGEPPFAVVLGNADGVQLRVAGAPFAIPRTGRQGNLARFAVDIAEE